MSPQARAIVKEVSARWRVNPKLVASQCRLKRVFYARVEAARLLDARGYSSTRIGAALGQDHTTIIYYLGRAKRKPKPLPDWRPQWKAPRIRMPASWQPKAQRNPMKAYLVPYAGADMTEYTWRERHGGTQ